MPVLFARIPEDRVGALIGLGGRTVREIARRTATSVEVDGEEGEVRVSGPDSDPMGVLKARDIVLAIGRGFSPERAFRLLKDNTYLGIVDIKVATGRRDKSVIRRVRSRVIGTQGRARTRIEYLSGCSMSVYGSTVALIGEEDQLDRATRALELLMHGSEHSTVFHLLVRLRRDAAAAEALAPSLALGDEE